MIKDKIAFLLYCHLPFSFYFIFVFGPSLWLDCGAYLLGPNGNDSLSNPANAICQMATKVYDNRLSCRLTRYCKDSDAFSVGGSRCSTIGMDTIRLSVLRAFVTYLIRIDCSSMDLITIY